MNAKENRFLFEKLLIYRKSLDFAVKITKIASKFPFRYSRIRDQFIGAAVSIPLNIAESQGRNSRKDQLNFINISKASLFECVPLLEISLSLELIDIRTFNELQDETVELSKMISSFATSLRRQ